MSDLAKIQEWERLMQEGCESYFGVDSRNRLAIGVNRGFATLHAQSKIADEDDFLSRLPPNRRSIEREYHERGASSHQVYIFNYIDPLPSEEVSSPPPFVVNPPVVASTWRSAWAMSLLICVAGMAYGVLSSK